MSTGYTALHDSAAWLDLPRAKIRVTGEDRVRFLHAMLTNDVNGLVPGQGNYHFLLNAQGRIQGDTNLYVFADYILLDCQADVKERIWQHLDKHIIADDVQLEDVTNSLATVALEGPKADEVAGVQVPPQSHAHVEVEGMIVTRTSLTGQPGVWFFLDPSRKAELIGHLANAGALAVTPDDAAVVRVENGIPVYGEDINDTTLPQETQQMRALHFNKGCYLGQEIVERIRARGQVHKLLVKLAIDGAEPPLSGSPIMASGQEIGKLTSPVYSPGLGHCLGLGIIRREFAGLDTAGTVAGRPSRVLH